MMAGVVLLSRPVDSDGTFSEQVIAKALYTTVTVGWVTSRFALPHQLVGLLVYEVRRMTANDSRWSTDPMGTRAYCLKWGDVRMRVVTACILSFGGWRKFSNIYWSVFVGSGGSSYPPKNIVQKIWKLYSGEANRVRLVEADTWHCLAYLTGADLVKLSWRNSSKFCKFGDRWERNITRKWFLRPLSKTF